MYDYMTDCIVIYDVKIVLHRITMYSKQSAVPRLGSRLLSLGTPRLLSAYDPLELDGNVNCICMVNVGILQFQ